MSYVGCTRRPIKERWGGHKTAYRQLPLPTAIRALGAVHFKFVVLSEALTIEDAEQKEAAAIVRHNTLWPNGYNRQLGGKLPEGHLPDQKHSEPGENMR